jgi:hypothetical protein
MRTTLRIDDDVFQAARAKAKASGRNLGEVFSELARRGLRSSPETKLRNRLPVFSVSPNAEIIPSTRARKMLAEDEP